MLHRQQLTMGTETVFYRCCTPRLAWRIVHEENPAARIPSPDWLPELKHLAHPEIGWVKLKV
jgi:hypothetical protein